MPRGSASLREWIGVKPFHTFPGFLGCDNLFYQTQQGECFQWVPRWLVRLLTGPLKRKTIAYMASLTVRLSTELETELEAASKARGVSKSDLAREAIERHLRFESLQRLRIRLAPHLERQGIFTEADVFKRLGEDQ